LPEALSLQPIGTAFIELQSIDSTNNYARQLIKNGLLPNGQDHLQHGTVVFAHEQTQGRGQMGKAWFSAKDHNIAVSILLKQDELPSYSEFILIASCALATREFFSNYAGDNTLIKWPNDLYWQDRKAAGILMESVVGSRESGVQSSESKRWMIIGIGININQTEFPKELQNPVSLKQITGKSFDCLALAKELCSIFNRSLSNMNADDILNEYNQFLYKRNEKVKFRKDNRVFEAVIKEVKADGRLNVFTSIDEEFTFGEITLQTPNS